jgi:hypothetical protein
LVEIEPVAGPTLEKNLGGETVPDIDNILFEKQQITRDGGMTF